MINDRPLLLAAAAMRNAAGDFGRFVSGCSGKWTAPSHYSGRRVLVTVRRRPDMG